MRRYLFLVIILLIIAGLFFMVPEGQVPPGENPYFILYRIMQLADAAVVEGECYYWALLGECPHIAGALDLEAKADELLKLVAGGPAGPASKNSSAPMRKESGQPFNAEENLSHTLYRVDSAAGENTPVYMVAERFAVLQSGEQMRLLLQRMEQEGGDVVHLLIAVNQKGEARQLGDLACRLASLLEPQTEKGSLTFCLTGHLRGELNAAEMQELIFNIGDCIGGKQLQSISDGQMISVTGYTPELGDYLQADNLRINLNMAMRYDEYLGKMVFRAASPLITRCY